jgi:carbonic anhydrase
VHHTNCGLQSLREDEFKQQLENETGVKPWWSFESFRDPFEDTRQSINRLRHSPFLLHKNHIRGFVYDVDNGRLLEVTA